MAAPSWMEQGSQSMGGMHEERTSLGVGGRVGGYDRVGPGIDAELREGNQTRFAFRVAALMAGALMIFSSMFELFNVSSFTRFCIAVYNILFAGVLILHESQGFVMCDGVDSNMRRYFGLLYGHMGRAIFIFFVAFLNFALTDASWWGTCTGIFLLVLGGLMLLVYLKHPHLLDEAPGLGDLKATPPRREEYAPPPTMPSTTL